MIFFRDYLLKINKPYDEAVEIFRNSLDDVSKKGYSMSGNTVVHNSDHGMNYFSGEYKNDCFVVREADISDTMYRYVPKFKISFKACGDKTEIYAKGSCVPALIVFVIALVFALLLMATLVMMTSDAGDYRLFLIDLVPIAIMLAAAIYSSKQISGTKATLEYIYKK